jgi:hypothetical protein
MFKAATKKEKRMIARERNLYMSENDKNDWVFVSEEESEYSPTPLPPVEKSAERGKAYRRRMKAKKDRRLLKIVTDYGSLPRVGSIERGWIDGVWQPTGTHIHFPKNSNVQKYLKRQSNRLVRRSAPFPNGNAYRKCMEYRWHFW